MLRQLPDWFVCLVVSTGFRLFAASTTEVTISTTRFSWAVEDITVGLEEFGRM
jgi:hypothetical protein